MVARALKREHDLLPPPGAQFVQRQDRILVDEAAALEPTLPPIHGWLPVVGHRKELVLWREERAELLPLELGTNDLGHRIGR